MSVMISPEQLLLRYCCRLEFTPTIKESIKKIIFKGVSWDIFLENAKSQGVLALLYKTIIIQNSDLAEVFPASFLDESKKSYYLTFARNALFLKSLEDIVAILNREHIEVIIFKGLMLAESVYQDLGVRPMSDIDILIKLSDMKKVDSLLRERGFLGAVSFKRQKDIFVNSQRNSLLYSKNTDISVFLHVYWHIINVLPYDLGIMSAVNMDMLWDDSIPVAIGNARLRIFSPEHQLIYLCMHAMNHSFLPLIRRVDISEFLRVHQETVDWDSLIKEAFRFRLSKYLYYGLYLVAETLGTTVPSDVVKRVRPARISFFEREFIASVLKEAPGTTEQGLVNIGMNESLLGRMRYVIRLLFPSPKELALMRQKEPGTITSLEYFRRLWESLKYGGRFLLKKCVWF